MLRPVVFIVLLSIIIGITGGVRASDFVLTRQGVIQEGNIVDGEQSIYLQFPGGKGGITISRIDLLFIAKSREEIFDYRLSQIHPNDYGELLRLADWAVRNQLIQQAITMLGTSAAQVTDLNARETMLQKREQLLFVEKIRDEALRKKEEPLDEQALLLQQQHNLIAGELESWGKGVPLSVQEKFIRKVQPILLKRCGTKECHGNEGESGAFVIDRGTGYTRRSSTLVNLKTIMEWVNFANPSNSPILTHPPMVDHQGNARYPFGNDSSSYKDYEAFTTWVYSLSSLAGSETAKKSNFSQSTFRENLPVSTHNNTNNNNEENFRPRQLSPSPVPMSETLAGSQADGIIGPVTGNINPGRFAGTPPIPVPKDVYDPVLFNSRYHPERWASSLQNDLKK